jgi:branched-chain amino acid transport system ATP-binding protein/urea transport system ATP-binding protein
MLSVEKLSAGYIKGSRVLDEISLDIGRGEVVALLGRNGMGKSTLLKSIAGQLKPQSGRISLGGVEIAGLPSHRIARLGIGYVPQGRDIFSAFSVEENLRMGVLGKPALSNVLPPWAFEMFPILAERRTQRAGTMSGGQQQQLAIMRALVGNPSCLLLDEPSEGIQPSIVHEIGLTLKAFASERNLTILLVEQNLDLVSILATRALFIENGQIVEGIDDITRLQADQALASRYLSV